MSAIPDLLASAIQHHLAGRLQAAEQIYRQILAAQPDHAAALHLLGMVAHQSGRLPEAVDCYRRSLVYLPESADAHNNLGNALKELGQIEAAIGCWRRAVELKPDYALAHNNLGVALKEQGLLEEAVACYRRALELQPQSAELHSNLGAALQAQGQIEAAVACCRRAIELKPDYAEAHSNMGVLLKEQGRIAESLASCCEAIRLKPDFAAAHNNLGNALRDFDRLEDAAACYRRALELKPNYAEAWNNLGNILKDQGRVEEAIAAYRQALAIKPDYVVAHSNLLFALQYPADVTPQSLAAAHAEYDSRHAHSHKSHEPRQAGKPDLLRVGFVSPDLGRHPVGYFLVRVLENFRPDNMEAICYSDRVLKDDLTSRLQAAAAAWHDCSAMSDVQLAEQVRADRIDILVDLAGHTAGNRMLVFARKPAAVQITWAGYVGTTGLASIDYLLADRWQIPPGAEGHYRERVLRMPAGYVCYDPPAYAPAVTPLPALDRRHVTLGCFNNPAKVTPQAVAVWSEILRRLPGTRLVLKFRGWNDPGVVRRYAEMFAARGIGGERVEFLGHSPHAELLAAYGRIDMALDPFPYCGGLTTCEALWMGVPVLTCPGETFAGRHSLTHLSNVGLTETIAGNLSDYVELAVALAGDLPRLAGLRAGLRARMAASPLCDGPRFAADLTSILQSLPAITP